MAGAGQPNRGLERRRETDIWNIETSGLDAGTEPPAAGGTEHLRREEEDVPQLDVIEFENLEADAGRLPNGRNEAGSRRQRRIRQRTAQKAPEKKRRILLAEILILLLLAAGVFLFYRWKTDSGYWTIAVFGVDSRDGIIESGTHSDVEMICVINKGTGEIRLVSVYRDTYLQVSEDGKYHKINQAYFDGGHEQAVEALNRNLDLEIDDYATFNWKAVADAITILGGIDLEISDSEFEYINSLLQRPWNPRGWDPTIWNMPA